MKQHRSGYVVRFFRPQDLRRFHVTTRCPLNMKHSLDTGYLIEHKTIVDEALQLATFIDRKPDLPVLNIVKEYLRESCCQPNHG